VAFDSPQIVELPLGGLRALIVEDHDDSRELLATLLTLQGAEVVAAASAGEALEALPDRFDVIVSDIGLPGETGFDLMRKVRARGSDQGGEIPAIALTAFTSNEDRTAALEAGFQVHLAKPVQLGALVKAILSIVGLP
jgi:CheY-like chemotaxis protein